MYLYIYIYIYIYIIAKCATVVNNWVVNTTSANTRRHQREITQYVLDKQTVARLGQSQLSIPVRALANTSTG